MLYLTFVLTTMWYGAFPNNTFYSDSGEYIIPPFLKAFMTSDIHSWHVLKGSWG